MAADVLWNGARLGMTVGDVLKTVQKSRSRKTGDKIGDFAELVDGPVLVISSQKFTSRFYFSGVGLRLVKLTADTPYSAESAKEVFSTLSDLLQLRYGTAKFDQSYENAPFEGRATVWIHGSVDVTLSRTDGLMIGGQAGNSYSEVSVTYSGQMREDASHL